jgi:hypothetical protein
MLEKIQELLSGLTPDLLNKRSTVVGGGILVLTLVTGILLLKPGSGSNNPDLPMPRTPFPTRQITPGLGVTNLKPTGSPTAAIERSVVLERGSEKVVVYGNPGPGRCDSAQLERWLSDSQRQELGIKPGDMVWVPSGARMEGWGFRCSNGAWSPIR